jgi:putative membrane protein
MGAYYSSGWGLVFWIGLWLLALSSLGNWGYTYRAHKKMGDPDYQKNAKDILDERYASGDITAEEYRRMKVEIFGEFTVEQTDIRKVS